MNFIKTIFKNRVRVLMLVLMLTICSTFTYKLISKNIINNKFEANNVTAELPIHIKIPSINVDSLIEKVGITKDGAMDSPISPSKAGWYEKGPRPGEMGNAVIDGHSGWKNNIPAIFDNLYKLKIGDKIYVEGSTGEVITFVVRESKKYKFTDDTTDVFISNDSGNHLNLITCTGEWNDEYQGRLERLVVFADIEI